MTIQPHSEPRTREEMIARKKAADQRQAEAARRLQQGRPPAAAPEKPVREPEPAPIEKPAAPRQALPAAPAKPFDPAKATGREIIAFVAAQYDLTLDDLLGESRVGYVAIARREAMGAVHQAKPHLSLPQLGRMFGGRDHTTVLHALRELGLKEAPAGPAPLAINAADDRGMRGVTVLEMPDAVPAAVTGAAPRFVHVDPTSLKIDANYQRDLSTQSLALIRRIVEGWSWSAFKPPIAVEVDGDLHVIDGQHTSIAAATHPGITRIPVMVVEAERREDRASAFVRHNRDRVRMSGQQIYHAMVAAGDPDALAVQVACERAGANVLRGRPAGSRYRPGDTMAVEVMAQILKRRGSDGLQRVVGVCATARLAPIRSHELHAVETLLFDPDHAGEFDEASITAVLRNLGPGAERDASVFSAQHRVPRWRGLAVVLARAPKRLRKPMGAGGEQ